MKTAEGHLLKDDLSNYDDSMYKKPSLTVDVVILTIIENDLKVLLIRRKYPPFKSYWAIPGGFVNIDKNESLEDAANRELKEETNLEGLYMEQLKTYGDPFRDPRSRVVSVAYLAVIPYRLLKRQNIIAKDDAQDVNWHSLKESIKKTDLAFDHSKILKDAYYRLQGKIWWSDIAFNFVSVKFTWNEIQNVYEIILGKQLSSSNFRRKISANYDVIPLNIKITSVGRPATYLTLLKNEGNIDERD